MPKWRNFERPVKKQKLRTPGPGEPGFVSVTNVVPGLVEYFWRYAGEELEYQLSAGSMRYAGNGFVSESRRADLISSPVITVQYSATPFRD